MATKKKNTIPIPAAADKATRGRHSKAPKTQAAPVHASSRTESASAEAAEAPITPTTESPRIVTPTPAEKDTTPKTQTPNSATPKANKLSALEAAAQVLSETGQAMNCQELIAAMAAKGYWRSPKGRTPAGTLYAALLRELQTKGDKARFCKTERGKFALRKTV